MRAVLFDLDGTLLDIDMERFLSGYFLALAPVIAEVTGAPRDAGLDALLESTEAMCQPHPGMTNREAFARRFSSLTRTELGASAWSRFDVFYEEEFPRLRGGIAGRPGAREAIASAIDAGMRVAIATNPIFPEAAIAERIRWAGIDDIEVDLVTTYERMTACKPLPAYFLETAQALDVVTSDCLMVGDDRLLDMAAADVGMRTFYVGPSPIPPCDWAGTLHDVASLLPRLARADHV